MTKGKLSSGRKGGGGGGVGGKTGKKSFGCETYFDITFK